MENDGKETQTHPPVTEEDGIPRCGESETVADFTFRASKIIPFSVLDGTTPIEYGD
jgi:hypothetical protein